MFLQWNNITFLFLLSFQFIYHKKTYGTSIKATKSLILSSVMENPEFQKQLQQQKEERVKKVKQFQQNKSPVSKSNSFPFKATGIFFVWFFFKKNWFCLYTLLKTQKIFSSSNSAIETFGKDVNDIFIVHISLTLNIFIFF